MAGRIYVLYTLFHGILNSKSHLLAKFLIILALYLNKLFTLKLYNYNIIEYNKHK